VACSRANFIFTYKDDDDDDDDASTLPSHTGQQHIKTKFQI
jgi:hypothetical protein